VAEHTTQQFASPEGNIVQLAIVHLHHTQITVGKPTVNVCPCKVFSHRKVAVNKRTVIKLAIAGFILRKRMVQKLFIVMYCYFH
jgi:hypothetical protein